MHALSRFDASLLEILYAVLDEPSSGAAIARLYQQQEYQNCLAPATVRLVEQALAKGMTRWLMRQGGWQQDRFLRDGQPRSGAIWQRSDAQQMGLLFGPTSLKFLMWLVAHPLGKTAACPLKKSQVVTSGDQLLILRTIMWLTRTVEDFNWLDHSQFACLPLVALFMPDRVTCDMASIPIDFSPTVTSLAWLLECLQSPLADHWRQMEQFKGRVSDTKQMLRIGRNQAIVLNSYLDALEAHGRRDLARFMLMALKVIVGSTEEPSRIARNWISKLSMETMRLADRTEVYQSASMFLATSTRLQAWTEECRSIGYFDDGYAASQLWLADWERYDGETTCERAQLISRQLSV